MDTKKLRQKILDLAIHGKLVPQDPNDEPASVLLQRIRTEKERLIKEGKIKRNRKSVKTSDTPHYEQMPFELPQGWVWCRLDDTCQIFGRIGFRGYTKEDLVEKGKGAITLSPSNIINNCMNYDNCTYISWAKYEESPEIKVENNDILLVKTGSSFGKCALVLELPFQATINPQFVVLKSITIHRHYLTHVLQSQYAREVYDNFVLGTAIPTFTQVALGNMRMPLPPFAEQQRIVDEVERWFKLIDTIEQGKADLQTAIKQAKNKILELAISGKLVPQDPTDEPASELLKRINPKAHFTCDNEHNRKFPDGWAILKVKDAFIINPRNELDDNTDVGFIPMAYINDGYSGEFKYAQKKWAEIKNGFTHFSDGDIAVAKISPCLENLKSMILKGLPNGVGAGTTELYVFRALYTSSEYSLFFFKSNSFVRKCVGTFNGVVGQQRVGKRIIEDILFPIPPSVEQERIVAKIKELFFFIDEIQESLEA